MSIHVKKGDNVLILAGKDKGKTGKILNANPSDNTVIVSGVNIVSKHKKPKSAEDKGGIKKIESAINTSNVQVICPDCKKATRIAHGTDGKIRFRKCIRCGATLDKAVTLKKDSTKAVEKTSKAEKVTKPVEKTAKITDKKSNTESKSVKKNEGVATKKASTSKTTTVKKSAETIKKVASANRKSSGNK